MRVSPWRYSLSFRKSKSITQIDRTLRITYPILFIGITALSVYNAYVTRVIHYEITLDKPIKPLRIGMASDLHLGKLFGGKELINWLILCSRKRSISFYCLVILWTITSMPI